MQAILSSLDEDVIWEASALKLDAVNPLRWHGLTLTLAHLLYRRCLSPAQVPEVLRALILALNFEQRSSTGSSTGTNVRDAACFGIWSLSRRYTTEELAIVDVSSFRNPNAESHASSVMQLLALELVVAACLDPLGNIRRGASAALQELIGRHPDTVFAGISVTQIVDYHAIGLRERAMTEVGYLVSRQHAIYWDAVFEGLLGWRAVESLDDSSRLFSAAAIAKLSSYRPFNIVLAKVQRIQGLLQDPKSRQVEVRHGLVVTLASVIQGCLEASYEKDSTVDAFPRPRSGEDLEHLLPLWDLINDGSLFQNESFTVNTGRPQLQAVAFCLLLDALARLSVRITQLGLDKSAILPSKEALSIFSAWFVSDRGRCPESHTTSGKKRVIAAA